MVERQRVRLFLEFFTVIFNVDFTAVSNELLHWQNKSHIVYNMLLVTLSFLTF